MNPNWENAAKTGDAVSLRDQVSNGVHVDALDRYGQTALMWAALGGHDEAAQVLVDAGAHLDVTAKYGLSALMLAALNGRETIVLILLAAGADRSLRGTGSSGFFDKTAADLARDRGLTQLADAIED